jgi:para-nitrobenzyl esterase
MIRQVFGNESTAALNAYGIDGNHVPASDPALGTVGTQLMTDTYFRCPAIMTSEWLTSKGGTVFLYQFEHPLPGTGSTSTRHSGELPYVFGWARKSGKGFMGATFSDADARLSEQMQLYWTNFAKTGNPNGDGLPVWPKTDRVPPAIMRFTSQGSRPGPAPNRAACKVLAKHIASQTP